MNIDNRENIKQTVYITDRKQLILTGVTDVRSFDDKSIILKTVLGMLAIDGEDLRIVSLVKDSGELTVEGSIGGAVFFEPAEKKKKRGFFSW